MGCPSAPQTQLKGRHAVQQGPAVPCCASWLSLLDRVAVICSDQSAYRTYQAVAGLHSQGLPTRPTLRGECTACCCGCRTASGSFSKDGTLGPKSSSRQQAGSSNVEGRRAAEAEAGAQRRGHQGALGGKRGLGRRRAGGGALHLRVGSKRRRAVGGGVEAAFADTQALLCLSPACSTRALCPPRNTCSICPAPQSTAGLRRSECALPHWAAFAAACCCLCQRLAACAHGLVAVPQAELDRVYDIKYYGEWVLGGC